MHGLVLNLRRRLLLGVVALATTASSASSEIGKPHSSVIKLVEKNFDDHLNDPANGLWLLKFYAPWCGHCKTLAPVLDAVAPFLAGKMSIGKVDCTSEKKLCERFKVRGYPTLKYYRDGDFHDYPLGRDKDSIITFGEKMSDRAVKVISTQQQAKDELLDKLPVAFVVHDPDASSENAPVDDEIDASGATDAEKAIEKLIRSTERTKVFGQVARRMQASGSFGLLSPSFAPDEIAKFFEGGDGTTVPPGGFVARIEEGVPVRLYAGELNSAALEEWIKEQNLAAVLELGGHNFHFVSRRGKSLAIAVYDPKDMERTSAIKSELKDYAVRGEHREEYIFGTMDGRRWEKFVAQFDVDGEKLPEVFVVDVPERTYWQNSSVVGGVSGFVAAVKNGERDAREQVKRKGGALDEFLQGFVDYMPYSLVAMMALFVGVFLLALPRMGGDDIVYPPPPPPPPMRRRAAKEEGEKAPEGDSDGSTKKDR